MRTEPTLRIPLGILALLIALGLYADLAVGVEGFVVSEPDYGRTGAVQVFYGALFADGFGSGGTSSWSAD